MAKDVHPGVINQQMEFKIFCHFSSCSLSLNSASLNMHHFSWFCFHIRITHSLISPTVTIISHLNRFKTTLQRQFCPPPNHSPPYRQNFPYYISLLELFCQSIELNGVGQWSPTFLKPRISFTEDKLPADQKGGDGLGMIRAHHIYCVLYFYYY